MTKDQELKALDAFIAKLGPQSYLGPWLAENRLDIERDIRTDSGIDVQLPAAARHEARGIVESAKQWADQTRRQAADRATSIVAQAQREGNVQRQLVADVIRRHAEEAARQLQRL
jgi:hypothetical protein